MVFDFNLYLNPHSTSDPGLRAPKAARGGTKGRKGAARGRISRCGACRHCLKPELKKACLDPRPPTPAGGRSPSAPLSAPSPPAAQAASDPGPPGGRLLASRSSADEGSPPEVWFIGCRGVWVRHCEFSSGTPDAWCQ